MANTEPQLALVDIQEPVLNTFWPPAPGLVVARCAGCFIHGLWLSFFLAKMAKSLTFAPGQSRVAPDQQARAECGIKRTVKTTGALLQPRTSGVICASATMAGFFTAAIATTDSYLTYKACCINQRPQKATFSAYLQFASQWLHKVCVKQLERL